MIKRVEVFDMDGTIVDSSHRYRTITNSDGSKRIDLDHWRANEKYAMQDSLIWPMHDFYKECLEDPEVYVIIATARVMGDADWQFVNEILGAPNKFLCREEGDCQSGVTLKTKPLKQLKNLFQFRAAIWHFWEDNVTYLYKVAQNVGMTPHYIPSNQGY